MDLSVELTQRIDSVERLGLVKILAPGDADPFVKLAGFCVVKVLSVCCVDGISGLWLSEDEREDVDFLGD